MVLYTIVPPEIIFNENKTDEGVEMSNNKTPRSMEINYFGEKVQVLLFSDDSMIVDRIITVSYTHLTLPTIYSV